LNSETPDEEAGVAATLPRYSVVVVVAVVVVVVVAVVVVVITVILILHMQRLSWKE
jgi:hypothetical protein